MASESIFKTKYATWNNFGLAKKDADLCAYELLAKTTNDLNIHEGTIFTYEQNALDQGTTGSENYLDGLNNLQYDLLYGDRYAYHGEDAYPASDLVMGVEDTAIANIFPSANEGYLIVGGKNFTRWSRVYINGEKVPSAFISSSRLRIKADALSNQDTVVVSQMGSSNTVFRSTPEYTYHDPNAENTETEMTEQ